MRAWSCVLLARECFRTRDLRESLLVAFGSQLSHPFHVSSSGARILYKYLPTTVGLRRLIFYKRHDLHLLKSQKQQQDNHEIPLITYVLLCECFSLRESLLTQACAVIDQLRARCCGYSALYINSLS